MTGFAYSIHNSCSLSLPFCTSRIFLRVKPTERRRSGVKLALATSRKQAAHFFETGFPKKSTEISRLGKAVAKEQMMFNHVSAQRQAVRRQSRRKPFNKWISDGLVIFALIQPLAGIVHVVKKTTRGYAEKI